MLGTWAIGGSHWGPSYDETEALRAIETAVDQGINAIDTAPVYGDGRAEELIGKAIRGKRERLFLATKCGLNIYTGRYERDLSPSYIERDLVQSLKRLGTDYIDLYQCHWPDPSTPLEETMGALLKHQKEGKIRHIGVSNFSKDELVRAAGLCSLFSLQPHYSLLERGIERDILPWCVAHDISLFSYGSLGAGLLTGKYGQCQRFGAGDARNFFYRFFKPRYWEKVRDLVDAVGEIARSKGVRPGAVAISWLLAQPGICSVIVGSRSPRQVCENVENIPVPLDDGEKEQLDRLSRTIYEGKS